MRPFSSYNSLSEVLEKYRIASEEIDSIPLFEPQIYKIQDDNNVYKHCVKEIWAGYVPMVAYNQIVRRSRVMSMLWHFFHIAMDETNKELTMRPIR